MKRTSLAIGVVAVALMAATAGGSAAQTAPTAANWISCQRQDLCTITHRRASRAGIRKLVPQKSASACSAAGFSYYLPVSSLEITMGNFVGWGSQMVRFFHEDDPTGQLFSCAFNVNPKYRREALLAGRRAYGWPVSPPVPSAPATPAAAAEQLGASGGAGADATPRETFALWTIEDRVLAATGAPLTHEAVATSEATELRIGCYVLGKESFVRAYLDQDLGGADTAQVSWGATGAQTEEWSLDQWEVSLEVPGGIGNLAIVAEIEAARDAGTLRLVVSPEGGSLRHQVELNLAGSLPALTAVRDKCAAAFSGQP